MAPEKGLDDDARGVDQLVGGLTEARARKRAAVASAVSSPSPSSPSSPSQPSPPSPPPPLAASTEKAPASGAALADDESRAEAEPPLEAAASSGPASAPRVVSATEAANSFLKTKPAAKEAAAEPKKSESASAPGAGSRRSVAEEARASVERERRLNDANGALVTAERELQLGRFASALDLATQAEALARGGLGLAPTSTRVRALWGLARAAEAAALAEGLLTVPAASTQLVDGLLAGADAALAVGDVRLRTRLLTKAASMENPDPARRAEAKRRLSSSPGTKAKKAAR
jgi:chemotaxis protein histidine kinase CheA